MKKCTRCILTEAFPNITFDEQGVCSVCHAWDKNWDAAKNKNLRRRYIKLFKDLEKSRGNYNCILAFSGGKDSAYALYLLKKKYNLNPLAVNFDNLFQTDAVRKWISVITKQLNVDLITYTPERENYLKCVKKSFEKTRNFCIFCNLGVYSLCQKIAAKNNINIIFSGSGKLEVNVISEHPELDYYKYAKSIFIDDNEIAWEDFKISQELCNMIKFELMGDVFDWNHNNIIETLNKNLGIEYPTKGLDYIHADCKIACIANYIYYKKTKMTKNEYTMANLVRAGQLTRKEALKKIEEEKKLLRKEPEYLEELLRLIKINRKEYENILKEDISYSPPWYHGHNK